MSQIAYLNHIGSKVGTIRFACTSKHVISVAIGGNTQSKLEELLISRNYTLSYGSVPIIHKLKMELKEYFGGKRRQFTIPPLFQGTAFQIRVWQTLHSIPFGETITYGELAHLCGYPNASRAVGGAMAKNKIPIIIPCHRVLAANRKLGGFTGGLDVKRFLLHLEDISPESHRDPIH